MSMATAPLTVKNFEKSWLLWTSHYQKRNWTPWSKKLILTVMVRLVLRNSKSWWVLNRVCSRFILIFYNFFLLFCFVTLNYIPCNNINNLLLHQSSSYYIYKYNHFAYLRKLFFYHCHVWYIMSEKKSLTCLGQGCIQLLNNTSLGIFSMMSRFQISWFLSLIKKRISVSLESSV